MIQRQQTLWLLLSTICAIATFKLPFYAGSIMVNNMATADELDAGSRLQFLFLTGISILLSVITIFFYKNRKLQLNLCIFGIVIALLLIILYFVEMAKFVSGSISLWCLFAFGNLLGYVMAARGVWKDEKLVKSLDKLR
jgi:hypothetical protein